MRPEGWPGLQLLFSIFKGTDRISIDENVTDKNGIDINGIDVEIVQT